MDVCQSLRRDIIVFCKNAAISVSTTSVALVDECVESDSPVCRMIWED